MDATPLQVMFWLVGAVVLLAWPLVGHWPRLGGSYVEGEHPIELAHMGPVVWGHRALPEGEERYLGWALRGRLQLRRYDFGPRLLAGRGFSANQLQAMEGVCTGILRLRLDGSGALTGAFFGRRFSMQGNKMVPQDTLDAVPRHWRRRA